MDECVRCDGPCACGPYEIQEDLDYWWEEYADAEKQMIESKTQIRRLEALLDRAQEG